MRGLVPKPLTDLYNPEYLELLYPQLLDQCESVFHNYFFTADMATNIEKHTRGQSHSKLWFQQCAGQVTASKLKAAVCTDASQPSMSLIKSVCYPESNCFKSTATSWGCEHEKTALEAYVLDIYHAYYFQVQAQLKFCCASYADFVDSGGSRLQGQ